MFVVPSGLEQKSEIESQKSEALILLTWIPDPVPFWFLNSGF